MAVAVVTNHRAADHKGVILMRMGHFAALPCENGVDCSRLADQDTPQSPRTRRPNRFRPCACACACACAWKAWTSRGDREKAQESSGSLPRYLADSLDGPLALLGLMDAACKVRSRQGLLGP